MGDPVQAKTQDKQVKGLLAHVFGSGSPKWSLFQRRLLSMAVDEVGRATVTANPTLNMDEVGLPEKRAWVIYRPFIMRRLIRRGMPATEAAQNVANQTEQARKAMLEELEERPVIINRAPTLHRYGFLAAWPKLVGGETLQTSPVIAPGYALDHDGDTMNYHVPVSPEAVHEAITKLMPSANLKSVQKFDVHQLPRNEFLMGLYLASTADNKNEPRIFKDKESAVAAYRRGEIRLGDRIVIGAARV
jgi:DNA-directed RNA polymerase subunit beta'